MLIPCKEFCVLFQVNQYCLTIHVMANIFFYQTYPVLEDDSKQLLPDSCFVTCSSDNTVRFWCLDPNTDQWNIRNIYSKVCSEWKKK